MIHMWYKEVAALHDQHPWYDEMKTTYVTETPPISLGNIPNLRVQTFKEYKAEIGDKEYAIDTDFDHPLEL